jgi:ABC-2 type transport system ATP-binding protein
MQQAIVNEIRDHIRHNDISLATRRILDVCLDIGVDDLLRESIDFSRQFRVLEKAGSDLPASFFTKAENILVRVEQAAKEMLQQNYSLLNSQQIAKRYTKGNFSLKPVNVSLSTGSILGVVGENGNGKTTLLRCLAGQLSLDQGVIKYELLSSPDYYSIKNHVVFIPQRIPKWYGQLKDNLHFAASLSGVTGADNTLMVDFMLERLNLSAYAHLTWTQISSGYRTRFEIARVLLQKPRLLILDEPLANLDINAQQTILTDLKFIAKSAHNPMGVILSSQQLHEVEKVADTVLFIKDGNCLFKSAGATTDTADGYVLEVETTVAREQLAQVLGTDAVQIHYNGGFYTITSSTMTASEIITKLVNSQVSMSYFRDITYSTKRFFLK